MLKQTRQSASPHWIRSADEGGDGFDVKEEACVTPSEVKEKVRAEARSLNSSAVTAATSTGSEAQSL